MTNSWDTAASTSIPVPSEGIAGAVDAGALHVLYGSRWGTTARRNAYLYQSSDGVAPGYSERGDMFGSSWVSGDFDGDGFDDIAISATGEDDSSLDDVGRVTVVFGSAAGLVRDGRQVLDPEDVGFAPEGDERFGDQLAAGDFDSDGTDDLAVGCPACDRSGEINAEPPSSCTERAAVWT